MFCAVITPVCIVESQAIVAVPCASPFMGSSIASWISHTSFLCSATSICFPQPDAVGKKPTHITMRPAANAHAATPSGGKTDHLVVFAASAALPGFFRPDFTQYLLFQCEGAVLAGTCASSRRRTATGRPQLPQFRVGAHIRLERMRFLRSIRPTHTWLRVLLRSSIIGFIQGFAKFEQAARILAFTVPKRFAEFSAICICVRPEKNARLIASRWSCGDSCRARRGRLSFFILGNAVILLQIASCDNSSAASSTTRFWRWRERICRWPCCA